MSEISLSLLVFRHRIKRASDASWHALCSQEYAKRWWDGVPAQQIPTDVSNFPGDRKFPFGAIKISPQRFVEAGATLSKVHIENGIIAIAGTFEAYMADLIGRCVQLNPNLLSTSDVVFKASELVQAEALASPVNWIAQEYVRKNVRNKSHTELIRRFGSMIKRDIAKANVADSEQWHKYVLLRNALVHAAGLTTDDLTKTWSSRFSKLRAPVVVEMADLVAAHRAAYGLADTIDAFALATVIHKSDAELLARELFVAHGEANPANLSRKVAHILGAKFSKSKAESAIAKQRREHNDPSREFTLRPEWLCRPHETT